MHVLGWWAVAPTSVLLRNAIKGVACAQTSVPLFDVKMAENCNKERARRLVRKRKRRQRAKIQPLPLKSVARSMSMRERSSLCHPSHTAHILLHTADRPKSMSYAKITLMCTCHFKGYWDVQEGIHSFIVMLLCNPARVFCLCSLMRLSLLVLLFKYHHAQLSPESQSYMHGALCWHIATWCSCMITLYYRLCRF